MSNLPTLKIGTHVSRYPIIQGGMGIRISGAKLAAAVANAGGIGVISAVGLGLDSPYFNPDEPNAKQRFAQFNEANQWALRDEIQKARSLSPTGILGINVMMAIKHYEALIPIAAEQGINLIIAGAGLPLQLPELTAAYPDVALVPIVSSVRAAKIICRKWARHYQRLPDAFVVESPAVAGGHLGAKADELEQPEFSLAAVVPELVRYVNETLGQPIPVIAAGGIWSRADIDRALALGASGVQMGTRFITTHECDADRRYKEFHLQAQAADVVIVSSPVGLPGRALRNPFVERVAAGQVDQTQPCLADCLQVCSFRDRRAGFCILRALDAAVRGDVEQGLIFSGSNAGRERELRSVADLMTELVTASS